MGPDPDNCRHRGKASPDLPVPQAPLERIHRDQGPDPDPEHRIGRPEPRAAERPGLQVYSVFISRKIGLAPGLIDTGLCSRRRSRSKNKPALCPKSR